MASDKRKRSGDVAKKASSKRQKVTSGAGKKVVSVNQLKWKKVEVPEMFDDAEGFYGLEEIEGVDIVREGNNIKFVAAADKTQVEEGDDGEEFEGFEDAAETSIPEKKSEKDQKKAPKEPKKESKDQKKQPKDQKKQQLKDDKDGSKDEKPGPKAQKKAQKVAADPELEANLFTKLDEIENLPEADVEEVDLTQWAPLNLSPQMMGAIGTLKFCKPSAIQRRAIPEIMKGHDVIGKASTGSGKTLAFGIPIVESWLSKNADAGEKDRKKTPITLILSPTRELAHQIGDHLKKLCDGLKTSPYICSVTGGLAIQKQQRQLEKADIIIGTPGRMWEVMSTSTSVLEAIKGISFLVVDEADRLLKDGQFKEAEEILKALDRTVTNEDSDDEEDEDEEIDEDAKPTPKDGRQTLVFSATFNRALQQKLAGKARYNLMGAAESLELLLKKLNFREPQPKFIDTNPVSQMAENLKEGLIHCGDLEKDLYLYAVLLLQPMRRALVFTNSINTVRRLTPFLQNLNLPAVALHSDMEQKARLRSLEKFRAPDTNGASPILVATDVAARGLDIPNVDLIIHYHVPRSADDYVHRSGRTARAEESGVSVLLCGPKEDIPTQRLIAKVHAAAASKAATKKSFMGVQTIDIDRRLVSHLRPRVTLSKKIAETTIAKERGSKEEDWLKNAAEELGVEYDSDELEKAGTWKGRGSGRKQKEKEAKEVTKAEMKQWRWELKELLSRRVNTGVSEKYLIGVDVDALLKGVKGEFLGKVDGLGL
ncbi:putative ATP-dependent RNA helicase mak-5 [Podospora fimiseda]|uniref:ATP-dependent RNA helicase n=1 Tax=Podospora fimiseda TaxID=252190 RepID=A0AAN7C0R9_9PEZI|nr:putative ATP-dependent RNA helicase mak-5 [Podospora fimiseda]